MLVSDSWDNAEDLRDKHRGDKALEDVRENWRVIGRSGARREVSLTFCTGGRGGADSCTTEGRGRADSCTTEGRGRADSCTAEGRCGADSCSTGAGSEDSPARGDEGRMGDRRDPDKRELDAAICARIFAIVLMVLKDEEPQ